MNISWVQYDTSVKSKRTHEIWFWNGALLKSHKEYKWNQNEFAPAHENNKNVYVKILYNPHIRSGFMYAILFSIFYFFTYKYVYTILLTVYNKIL